MGDKKLPSPVMIFEMGVIGQYGYFIKYLVQYWKNKCDGRFLYIVVRRQFADVYADVVNEAAPSSQTNIQFVVISDQEQEYIALNGGKLLKKLNKSAIFKRHFRNRIKRWRELNVCRLYAARLRVNHCHLMTLDYYIMFLCMGFRLPCAFSGIYYQPSFHYQAFSKTVLTLKERLKNFLQRVQLRLLFMRCDLSVIFMLDPFAADCARTLFSEDRVAHLPEPVRIHSARPADVEGLKKKMAIEKNRVVFLMFGAIGRRRGIHQVLQAILLMRPSLCTKLCLLLIGPVAFEDRMAVDARISEIRMKTSAQIVREDGVILEQNIRKYFELADVVLATHIRHVGSSGNLIHAAGARKPVLASDFGLIGEIVRRHQLGITVDTVRLEEIKRGFSLFIEDTGNRFFNKKCAKDFAQMNSAERYASIIIEEMF